MAERRGGSRSAIRRSSATGRPTSGCARHTVKREMFYQLGFESLFARNADEFLRTGHFFRLVPSMTIRSYSSTSLPQ